MKYARNFHIIFKGFSLNLSSSDTYTLIGMSHKVTTYKQWG